MSISGVFDYRILVEHNRASDPKRIGNEIQRLVETGLSAVDIATALHIDLAVVHESLDDHHE